MSRVAKLTAAIATVDRPEALARCLDALLTGDMLPSEIIVVDQSQDDQTRLAVQRRQNATTPIVYVRQPRRGLSASRNAALAAAHFPILAVTDDDCVPDPGWIAAIDRTFSSPGAPDAMTGRVLPLGPERPGLYAVSSRGSALRAEFTGKVLPWVVGTGANFAVKCQWLSRIGGYDERLGTGSPGKAAEDTDLLYRLLRLGVRIRYEPDAVIYHERQTKRRRLTSRWSYGYGIGAFCGMWLGRRDPYAVSILAHWLRDQLRALASALGRLEALQACQRMLSLSGTILGLIYGLRQSLPHKVRQATRYSENGI